MAKTRKNRQTSYSTYTSGSPLFWLKWLVLLGVFGGFGFVVWYASVHKEELQSENGQLTLIESEKSSVKERAENPGGMEVANRDKQIFDLLEDPEVQQAEEDKFKEICTAKGGDIVCNEALPKVAEIKKKESAEEASSGESQVDLASGDIGTMIEKLDPAAEESKKVVSAQAEKVAEKIEEVKKVVEKAVETQPTAVVQAQPKVVVPKETATAAEPVKEAPKAVEEKKVEAVSSNASISKGDYGVQLASYRGLAEAQNGSKIFTSKFKELKSLTMDVQKADVKGKTYYRLRYFGFENKTEAGNMCSKLKAKGQGCFRVQY